MEIPIYRDRGSQIYVQWRQGCGGYKRAWTGRPKGLEKDWAGGLDALNMVGVEEPHGGPVGNSTDFPVCSDLEDGQILIVFVTVVASLTGGVLEYCLMPMPSNPTLQPTPLTRRG